MLADLDVYDAINAEIWAKSLRAQAAVRDQYPAAAADLLQAVLPGGSLPWVPDLVGERWREAGSLFIVGSAYAPFVDAYGTRSRVMSEYAYRKAATAAAFQRAFVRDVVSGDRSYYGPLLKLVGSVGRSPRQAVFLDLVRGSFVRLANFEGGDQAIAAAPALFSAYMAAGWRWTWRRLCESRARDIAVLGRRAERGLLTMLGKEGVDVRVAPDGERASQDDNILANASARDVAGWLRDRTWWEAAARIDGREKRWRILTIVHPAWVNRYDPGYAGTARLLRRMLDGEPPSTRTAARSPTTPPREGGARLPNWMPSAGRASQRDVMRSVWARFGPDEARVVAAYAVEERAGTAPRASNTRGETAEEYARRLLYDGIAKGWLRR